MYLIPVDMSILPGRHTTLALGSLAHNRGRLRIPPLMAERLAATTKKIYFLVLAALSIVPSGAVVIYDFETPDNPLWNTVMVNGETPSGSSSDHWNFPYNYWRRPGTPWGWRQWNATGSIIDWPQYHTRSDLYDSNPVPYITGTTTAYSGNGMMYMLNGNRNRESLYTYPVTTLIYDGRDTCVGGIQSVSFAYHMYGPWVGEFKLITDVVCNMPEASSDENMDRCSLTLNWSKDGDQGNQWHVTGEIPLGGSNQFSFLYESKPLDYYAEIEVCLRENPGDAYCPCETFTGCRSMRCYEDSCRKAFADIAIDRVQITCIAVPPFPPPPAPPGSPSPPGGRDDWYLSPDGYRYPAPKEVATAPKVAGSHRCLDAPPGSVGCVSLPQAATFRPDAEDAHKIILRPPDCVDPTVGSGCLRNPVAVGTEMRTTTGYSDLREATPNTVNTVINETPDLYLRYCCQDGMIAADMDNDGDLDLILVNEFNMLLINDGQGVSAPMPSSLRPSLQRPLSAG